MHLDTGHDKPPQTTMSSGGEHMLRKAAHDFCFFACPGGTVLPSCVVPSSCAVSASWRSTVAVAHVHVAPSGVAWVGAEVRDWFEGHGAQGRSAGALCMWGSPPLALPGVCGVSGGTGGYRPPHGGAYGTRCAPPLDRQHGVFVLQVVNPSRTRSG